MALNVIIMVSTKLCKCMNVYTFYIFQNLFLPSGNFANQIWFWSNWYREKSLNFLYFWPKYGMDFQNSIANTLLEERFQHSCFFFFCALYQIMKSISYFYDFFYPQKTFSSCLCPCLLWSVLTSPTVAFWAPSPEVEAEIWCEQLFVYFPAFMNEVL